MKCKSQTCVLLYFTPIVSKTICKYVRNLLNFCQLQFPLLGGFVLVTT